MKWNGLLESVPGMATFPSIGHMHNDATGAGYEEKVN